jgi:hypothetical protein
MEQRHRVVAIGIASGVNSCSCSNSVSDRIFGRHGRVRLLCLAPIAIHYESQLDARRLICIGTKRDTAMLT